MIDFINQFLIYSVMKYIKLNENIDNELNALRQVKVLIEETEDEHLIKMFESILESWDIEF